MQDLLARPVLPHAGKVWLIGAGPGAIDLITVRGAALLGQAEVVLHDALVTSEILGLCSQAHLVSVGKRSGQRSTAQTVINQQLIACARRFERVVRLKGGDPMLFGRADEELRALESADIRYEIVPGITTAFAAAAAICQPLTKRGVARNVAFFTSTTAKGETDEAALPSCDTLIQYMGGHEAISTAKRLLAVGKSPDTPVIAIENVSRTNQKVMRMTLIHMAQGLPDCSGPVLVMIGEALRARIKDS
ncbi:MAG: uroporphyrinogen-III C-methyltransferase [Oxalobacteraceae bacterium]|jgi:uroporphyrin-III C-methyltransferase|nr:uroporphyrinogen-III C-methyltransferase [Oxalobacteraceae bacterium]